MKQIMTIRFLIVLVVGIISICAGGCASDYSVRDDLSSVQSIGLAVPTETIESIRAEDFIQLFDDTIEENRLKNSAVGAGKGAAIGTVTGVGVGALLGCAATGPYAPICWATIMVPAVVAGAGTGVAQVADTDTRERVAIDATQIYGVKRALQDIQDDYLTKNNLEKRAIRVVRRNIPDVKIIPVEPDEDRYRFVENHFSETKYSDINLLLTSLNIRLEGKREDQPKASLFVDTTWLLTKNDSSMTSNVEFNVVEGSYQSEYFYLSEWLAEDGTLLTDHIGSGLDYSFNRAFTDLTESHEDKWAGISPDEDFD